MVLDGLPGLYGLKYDSATACGLPLYLCSYKLNGSVTGGSVKCDLGSMMVRATRLIAGASSTTLDGGVCFPGEFSMMAGAFASG